jgi:Type IV secretion-system coupling protein DNA-binding domain
MEKINNIYFGPAPQNLVPGTKIRRWDTSIGGGFVFALVFSVISILLTWKPLPIFGPVDATHFSAHIKYWFEIILNAVSSHQYFEIEAHRYIAYANQIPFPQIYGRLVFGAVMFLVSFAVVTKMLLTPRDQIIHVSGNQLKTGEAALRIAKTETKKAEVFMRVHKLFGLPKTKWTRHMLIYGSVGSGKTQILLPILQQIFEGNHKAILYDVKGDFTSIFNKALLISPWDKRSAIWDLAKDISTRDSAQEFAASLIPEGKDPFWANAGQFLLTGIIFSLQTEKGQNWGWKDLSERCNYNAEQMLELMKIYYAKGANVIADPTSAQSLSVIATLAGFTRLIDDLAIAWGDTTNRKTFSLLEWIKDDYQGPRQIILQAGKGEKLTGAYIAAMINAVVPEIISPALPDDEKGRTLFFILDEFTSLSKIKIQPLIDKGRSKGCCVILGFQDIAQVRKVYGPDDAKAITSMVATHIVCQVGPGETREFVANQIVGKRRIATLNTNVSKSAGGTATSTSFNEEDRPILIPSQLTSELGGHSSKCATGFAIRALYISGSNMLMLDFEGVDAKKLITRKSYMEAEWVKPNALIQFQNQIAIKVPQQIVDAEIEQVEEVEKKKVLEVTQVEIEMPLLNAEQAQVKTENRLLDAAEHAIDEILGDGMGSAVSIVLDDLLDSKPKPNLKVSVSTVSI